MLLYGGLQASPQAYKDVCYLETLKPTAQNSDGHYGARFQYISLAKRSQLVSPCVLSFQ